jgi:arsenate reductase-like glutaredoxin family protein
LGSLFGFLGRLALKAGPLALIGASLVALEGKDWEKLFSEMSKNIDLISNGKWLEGTSGIIASLAETITKGFINLIPISEESKKEITDKLNEIDLSGKARSISKAFGDALEKVFGEQVASIADGVAAIAAVGITIGLSKKIFTTLSSGAFWLKLGIPALLVGGVLLYGDQIRESLEKFFSEQPMPDWADPGLTAGLTTGALGAAGAAMGVRSLAQLVGAGRFAGRGALAAGLATFTIMAGNSLKDWLDDQGKLNPITDTLINATSFAATGASLAMMFGLGPKGILIGAAAGLAIGLGYSLVNWLNGIKDKQDKILQERLSVSGDILSRAAQEGKALTDEQKSTISGTLQEVDRALQLAKSEEQRKILEESKRELEEALASQPLSPDRVNEDQLFERVRRVKEGDQTALMELRNLFAAQGLDAEKQLKFLGEQFAMETMDYEGSLEKWNQSIKSIDQLMQEKTEEVIQKHIDANERLRGVPDQTVPSLGEGVVDDGPQAAAVLQRLKTQMTITQAAEYPTTGILAAGMDILREQMNASQAATQEVQVTSSKALADYNEAMEKMKREEEAIARRREQAASTQVPIVVNNNNVQQGGNGGTAPVGPLHTRPTESRLDDMLLGGSLGIP